MPETDKALQEVIRAVLADHGASAPMHDTDTLAGLIATAVKTAEAPTPDVADGHDDEQEAPKVKK